MLDMELAGGLLMIGIVAFDSMDSVGDDAELVADGGAELLLRR